MPFFVGPGSSPDGGLEMKSDRVGMNTSTLTALSGVGTANGDAYSTYGWFWNNFYVVWTHWMVSYG